eukprot:gene26149-56911_t
MLQQIVQLVGDAQASKAPIQKYADRISAVFVPLIVAYALVVLAVWMALSQPRGVFPLNFFIATIVIACPCAMGLAAPTA